MRWTRCVEAVDLIAKKKKPFWPSAHSLCTATTKHLKMKMSVSRCLTWHYIVCCRHLTTDSLKMPTFIFSFISLQKCVCWLFPMNHFHLSMEMKWHFSTIFICANYFALSLYFQDPNYVNWVKCQRKARRRSCSSNLQSL